MYIYIYIYIYIYVYRERERERSNVYMYVYVWGTVRFSYMTTTKCGDLPSKADSRKKDPGEPKWGTEMC